MHKKTLIILVAVILMILSDKFPLETENAPWKAPATEISSVNKEQDKPSQEKIPGFYPVVRTVDGDTIVVAIDGTDEKIRLIGVDTPESVDPRKTVECFGKEASNFTKNLLSGKQVRLEADPTQGDRDKYGRLLRYVFLGDETLVNKLIITEGYGHEYTYRIPYQYQQEFKDAQNKARTEGRGLWAAGACE